MIIKFYELKYKIIKFKKNHKNVLKKTLVKLSKVIKTQTSIMSNLKYQKILN
jgi:hypothetical protein